MIKHANWLADLHALIFFKLYYSTSSNVNMKCLLNKKFLPLPGYTPYIPGSQYLPGYSVYLRIPIFTWVLRVSQDPNIYMGTPYVPGSQYLPGYFVYLRIPIFTWVLRISEDPNCCLCSWKVHNNWNFKKFKILFKNIGWKFNSQ